MDFNHLSFANGLLVSLFSMLIVFAVLLIISYLIDATAFVTRKKEKEPERSGSPEAENTGSQLDARTLALITGALSAYAAEGSRLVIRKIRRPAGGLSGWETAGLQDGLRRAQ